MFRMLVKAGYPLMDVLEQHRATCSTQEDIRFTFNMLDKNWLLREDILLPEKR